MAEIFWDRDPDFVERFGSLFWWDSDSPWTSTRVLVIDPFEETREFLVDYYRVLEARDRDPRGPLWGRECVAIPMLDPEHRSDRQVAVEAMRIILEGFGSDVEEAASPFLDSRIEHRWGEHIFLVDPWNGGRWVVRPPQGGAS